MIPDGWGIRYLCVCAARVCALQTSLSSVAAEATKLWLMTPRAPGWSDSQQPATVLPIQAQTIKQAADGDTGECRRG